jgi:AcrR family transcriptional regulator
VTEQAGLANLVPPKSNRGRARRNRILDAATTLFLENGYGETSIDAIVERSGGSKATLYSYFSGKDELFRAVIDSIVSIRVKPEFDPDGDVRSELVSFALRRMDVVFSSQHRALLRLIVGERERFPDIARMYYYRGPKRSREFLTEYMTILKDRGLLAIEDAAESAEFLIGMLFFEGYLEQLYLGEALPSNEQRRERSERVVDRFMEAFHK